ncbi:deglycase PfpI [Pyrofollis japonicus]|uniref:type 1 glutamine amidotransferase domain-containing protein n=1 Tax=Pyrofollis japonicus TaxID=3060460 RepID=UPI00295AF08F|nr:type 1 glutamine amidotransferase domain-containing protein [Pyrofollis japonicus]BEP18708.1 deglycase PfpI [Pyrofollis japonicus]
MPKALFIIEEGFDDLEFFYAYHRLIEEGFEPVIASSKKYDDVPLYDPETGSVKPRPRRVKGKHGLEVETNLSFKEALERIDDFDVLVLPGGRGPERARRHPEAVEIVKRMAEKGKPILAICHGPQLLVSAGVARGKRMTAYWGIRDDIVNAGAEYVDADAVRDGNIVTVRHTTVLGKGTKLFIELLKERGLIKA